MGDADRTQTDRVLLLHRRIDESRQNVFAYKPISEIVAGGMSTVPDVTLSIPTARFPRVQIGRSGSAAPSPGAENSNRPRARLSIPNAQRIDNHRLPISLDTYRVPVERSSD
jgi:hypothetical protein